MDNSDIERIAEINIPDDLKIEAEIEIEWAMREIHNVSFRLETNPWIRKTVARVSASLENEFGFDAKDIAAHINEKVLPLIGGVSNPNERPITECVHAWIYKSAHRFCLNQWRHLKVIERHEQAIAHELTRGKINSVPIQKSAGLTPEEELLQNQSEKEWESRKSEMRIRVRRVISSFPQAHQTIARLWIKGCKMKDISTETGIALATVYRKLGEVQKAVRDEIGVEALGLEDTPENKAFLKSALRQLVANSLQGL